MSSDTTVLAAVSRRYRRLAALCRRTASKIDSLAIRQSLLDMALVYDRKREEALGEIQSEPAVPMLRTSPFRFALANRKRRLGAHTAIHGSD